MNQHISTSSGIAVLNLVLNYVLSRRWRDYDDFSIQLTERIIARHPKTQEELSDLILKTSGQFFKLNHVSRQDFVRGFPSSHVIRKLSTSIVFTNARISQVHRTIQTRKPNVERIYTEDIDSFSHVRNVSRADGLSLAPVDVAESFVKEALAKILAMPSTKDWGGERSDLYGDVKFRGRFIPAAFMLKGNGTPGKLTVRKCGKNGDQVLRLIEEPARLFVVQHVDVIDSNVVKLLEIAVGSVAKKVQTLYYCVVDGVETARLLLAYGFLKPNRC